MLRNSFLLRLISGVFFCLAYTGLGAQETNSRASGRVISKNEEARADVTVILIHESTQNKYVSLSANDGYFHFFNFSILDSLFLIPHS